MQPIGRRIKLTNQHSEIGGQQRTATRGDRLSQAGRSQPVVRAAVRWSAVSTPISHGRQNPDGRGSSIARKRRQMSFDCSDRHGPASTSGRRHRRAARLQDVARDCRKHLKATRLLGLHAWKQSRDTRAPATCECSVTSYRSRFELGHVIRNQVLKELNLNIFFVIDVNRAWRMNKRASEDIRTWRTVRTPWRLCTGVDDLWQYCCDDMKKKLN
jgi:hypothetical protein